MNTPLDESLHSFLIRQQMIHMHKFDPKGVISADGRWRETPFAHHEVIHLFEKYDDLFLLETIDMDVRLGEKNHQFFDRPDAYCLSIESTFFRGSTSSYVYREQRPIVYCPACIQDMIQSYGFAYFRKGWHQGNWCDVHDVALHSIQSKNYRSSVQSIRKLLSGQKVQSRSIENAKPRKNNTIDTSSFEFFYPIKAVQCSARHLGYSLLNKSGELLSIDFPVERKVLNRVIKHLIKMPFGSEEFILALRDFGLLIPWLQKLAPVIQCINKDFSYVRLWVGARNELSEILLVPKEKRCDLCDDEQCKSWMQRTQPIENIDIKYLFENSTSLRRLILQQMHLPITGSQLWSPIKIKSWIDMDDLAKATRFDISNGGVSR